MPIDRQPGDPLRPAPATGNGGRAGVGVTGASPPSNGDDSGPATESVAAFCAAMGRGGPIRKPRWAGRAKPGEKRCRRAIRPRARSSPDRHCVAIPVMTNRSMLSPAKRTSSARSGRGSTAATGTISTPRASRRSTA
jgi:hypothetical protein